jgi:hypothetical protein
MDDFDNQSKSFSLVSKKKNPSNRRLIAWKTGHVYNANYLFQLTTTDITEKQPAVPAGSIIIDWKR